MMKILRWPLIATAIIAFEAFIAHADTPVEETGKLSQPLNGKTVFVIQGSHNLNGSIKIISESDEEVNVTYKKLARASSESQAKRFLDLIDLKLESSGEDHLNLIINTPAESPWEGSNYGVSIEILIELPENMKIEGDLRFMKLDVTGPFKGVTVKSGFSALRLEDINGPIDIATSYASINLVNVTGDIRAETRNGAIEASDIKVPMGSAIFQNNIGAITLSNITGPVEAYTSYSPITVSDINASDGSVVLRTTYSPITVADVSGELVCETSFSPISISDINLTHGHTKIETSYSPIKAIFNEINDSQLFLNTTFSNISLEIPSNTSSQIVANVDEGGKIHVSDLPIKPTYLGANRLEGQLNGDRSRIELKVGGVGEINIESQ